MSSIPQTHSDEKAFIDCVTRFFPDILSAGFLPDVMGCFLNLVKTNWLRFTSLFIAFNSALPFFFYKKRPSKSLSTQSVSNNNILFFPEGFATKLLNLVNLCYKQYPVLSGETPLTGQWLHP